MPSRPPTHSGGETPTADYSLHPSLVRPALTLGVERHVAALEATLGLALVVGVGPSLLTIGVTALLIVGIHPAMVWLTARDPQATEVYLRSRRYADYYAPAAVVDAPTPRPAASVPRAR
jgi:type IV secretory pathway TrbD component